MKSKNPKTLFLSIGPPKLAPKLLYRTGGLLLAYQLVALKASF